MGMSHSAAEPSHKCSSAAAAFAESAEQVLGSGAASQIESGDIERVLTAAMKLYAAKAEGVATPAPPVSDKITPTEAVVVISETMRALDLNLFDLSMWYRRAR
jgi:hypothetical protein